MRARAAVAVAWRETEPRRGEDPVASLRAVGARARGGSRSRTRRACARRSCPRGRASSTRATCARSRRRSSRRSSPARRRPCRECRPGTRRRAAVHRREARELRARDAGLGVDRGRRRPRAPAPRVVHARRPCRAAAVAHQQVAAEAENSHRLVAPAAARGTPRGRRGRRARTARRRGPPARQLVCCAIGSSRASSPRRPCEVGAARVIDHARAAQLRGDAARSSPRPWSRTTSPSRATRADRRRHLGDRPRRTPARPCPATRTARASARPSAATIGASPAGIDFGQQQRVDASTARARSPRTGRACACSGAAGRRAPGAARGRRRARRRASPPSPPGDGRSRRPA